MKVTITQIDTACMIIDINGFRIVTDPAFDKAGGIYAGKGFTLTKTGSPALSPEDIGPVDLVLLSHDHHKDNLDNAGREFIKRVPRLISTPGAVERLQQPNVTGLHEWESVSITTEKVPGLHITATPCQHAPDKEWSKVAGHVIGFMIEWEEQENGALYISGDTVLFEGIYEIADRFQVNTAILHIGKAGFPGEAGDLHFTFTTREALETARLLKVQQLVPTHFEGWEHFQEKPAQLFSEANNSTIKDKLVWCKPGVPVAIEI
jgi:L-ascorbate metabolism protein UlaG (beta-lactamase superfamily)